jgi:glutarate dioxygenase
VNAHLKDSIYPSIPDSTAAAFSLSSHLVHPRLRRISIDPRALQAFYRLCARVDVQNLEYVPFMRFVLAKSLESCVGEGFGVALRSLVAHRATGGFTLGVEGVTSGHDDFVKLATAVGHLLGPANHDSMSEKFYARFVVKHTDVSDSYLRQAYRLFTLHTDGTFVDEATDWLLMMKFTERFAMGGESRLLHLDDWEERDLYATHRLARKPIRYKAPGSKQVEIDVVRPTFFDSGHGLAISFIDQFAQPESLEEARYLHDMSSSMEKSRATSEVPLPVGDLVVLNNYFWLHGRASFARNEKLHRELLRIRGMFYPREVQA